MTRKSELLRQNGKNDETNDSTVELALQAKIKIADKPIRCLAQTWYEHQNMYVGKICIYVTNIYIILQSLS